MFEPVPAICRIPGPPLKAASSAMTSSPTTSERSTPKSSKTAVIHSVMPGMVALATPHEAACTPFTPACAKTSFKTARRLASAASAPTRKRLMEPLCPLPTTFPPATMAARVCRAAAIDSQNQTHTSLSNFQTLFRARRRHRAEFPKGYSGSRHSSADAGQADAPSMDIDLRYQTERRSFP